MAGVKHRYLIVRVYTQHEKPFKANIRNVLYKSLKDNFGDVVLSKIDSLEVVEFYETLQIAIIKCNLLVHKYVCYSLATMGSLNGLNVYFKIEFISGILRKAKLAFLKKYGNQGAEQNVNNKS